MIVHILPILESSCTCFLQRISELVMEFRFRLSIISDEAIFLAVSDINYPGSSTRRWLQASSLWVLFKNHWLTIGARDEPGLEDTFVLGLINSVEFIGKPLLVVYYKWILQHQRPFMLKRISLRHFFVLYWGDGEGLWLSVDKVDFSGAWDFIHKTLSMVVYLLHSFFIILLYIIRENLLRKLIRVRAAAKRHPLTFREVHLWCRRLRLDSFQLLYQCDVFTLHENVISCSGLIGTGDDV